MKEEVKRGVPSVIEASNTTKKREVKMEEKLSKKTNLPMLQDLAH
jgi:hypothetical protein